MGTVACYKAVRGSCLTMWIKVFFTWTILFDLVLSSSQYCFSTHGNLISEGTKVKRKRKHGLMITHKRTLAELIKRKELWFIKELYIGKNLRGYLLRPYDFIDEETEVDSLLINSFIYSGILSMTHWVYILVGRQSK